MAGNTECANLLHGMDEDYFQLDGKQWSANAYTGCSRCPDTWERKPYFELSIKNRRKYPLCTHYSRDKVTSTARQRHSVDDSEHLAGPINIPKSNECNVEIVNDSLITKQNINGVENVILKLETYISFLKSRLETLKERGSGISNNIATRREKLVGSALRTQPAEGDVRPSVYRVRGSESHDEVTAVMGRRANTTSETRTGKRRRVRSRALNFSDSEESKSDNCIDLIGTSKSSDDEAASPDDVTQVDEEIEKLIQGAAPDSAMEQSSQSSSEDSSD